MVEEIELVAVRSGDPILLQGPTGAGKGRMARRIYELRKSRHQLIGEFVSVNCATLRGDLAMSNLFGHVRGAYTGSLKDRPGLLKTADRGILFLDEIAELGLDEQAMLLKALEDGTFFPVGSDTEIHSDFQLIAGTNRDLAEDCQQGRFREDLLARLNLWTFHLPALRDRAEDLEPNLDFELRAFALKTGERVRINQEARRLWLRFALSSEGLFPGNFRDLNASVVRMATLALDGIIDEKNVEQEIRRLRQNWAPFGQTTKKDELLDSLELDSFDRIQLREVVSVCRQSRSLAEAGRKLFEVSRQKKSTSNDSDRLKKYLARFGLDWEVLQI